MGNVVNQIAINDTIYRLRDENASLTQQIRLLLADLIRIEAVLDALNVQIPVDKNLSALSNNPISNKSVSDTFDKVDSRLKVLEDKWEWLNLSDMATRDYVMSNINLYQLNVRNSLDKNSNEPISSSAVANEITSVRNALINQENLLKLNYVTKDYLQNTILKVDNSLSSSSNNPVANKVVTKELNKVQSLIEDCANMAKNSQVDLTFDSGSNSLCINGTPILKFTLTSGAFKINVLNGKKEFTISTTALAATGNSSYNLTTGELTINLANNNSATYNSSTDNITIS